jgi:hypothetical protein
VGLRGLGALEGERLVELRLGPGLEQGLAANAGLAELGLW